MVGDQGRAELDPMYVIALCPSKKAERGGTALGLLGVLCLMAALAVFVLQAVPDGRASSGDHQSASSVGTSSPAGIMASAATALCQSDYQTIDAAVEYYEAENGVPPKTIEAVSSFLNGSLTSPYFIISITPTHPGVVQVAAKDHKLSPGDGNCAFAG